MIIQNREDLISSSPRARAIELIEFGIRQVMPSNLMKSAVKMDRINKRLTIKGDPYDILRGRIFVIGGGKAAGQMAGELEEILGPGSIRAGIVNCDHTAEHTTKISINRAGHPLPDEAGVHGIQEMLAMKARYSIGKGDIVICLISGGGSSLLPYGVSGVTLDDHRIITEQLLRCGADIKERNIVRKHVSLTKGGNLGKFYEPATVISLVISDVVGDDLDVIASGPTVPDSSTFKDAYAVLDKYNLLDKAPASIVNHIVRGCQGREAETPKTLNNCINYIIGNTQMALESMAEKVNDLGLKPLIITSDLTGDTAEAAYRLAADVKAGLYKGFSVLLLGGDTTPRVPDNAGKGGRNQHFAAVSMLAMQGFRSPWLVASAGTDGTDYITGVAGAIVDDLSLEHARSAGINVEQYINSFDSNTLFDRIGRSLIVTGPTSTDVSDIILYLLN